MANLDREANVAEDNELGTAQGVTRVDPPVDLPESETLDAFLDLHRATLLRKIAGLNDEQLRRRLVPSDTTLLGMVKHLGYVEQNWFQVTFLGLDLPVPWSEADPDADFRIEPDESTESVLAWYQEQVALSRAIAAAAGSLDAKAKRAGREDYTLRWIMVHMIEETARHNGHADILRELIDGATGE
jgi:uncharacterized damage-inducible protein DinB